MVATFIRNLGYNAIPFMNDTAAKHPSCLAAGLGETARNRQLASPEFGPGERLMGLLTDIPMEEDRPIDFGFKEMCQDCAICAKSCPGNAIPLERDPTDGYTRNDVNGPCDIEQLPGAVVWHNNRLRCAKGSAQVGGCSTCKAACPWSSPTSQWHDRAKWLAINAGSIGRPLLVWMYDAFGYGKKLSPQAWLDSPVRPITGLGGWTERNT
jgi:reductive dehalogenase